MESQLNILIVDDHQMFIDGLMALLRNEKQFNILATANRGKNALEILQSKEIDIVISDISMPEMTGVELTRIIKSQYPEIKVLVLSMYDDREIIEDIILSEADGYILKNTGKKELVSALTKIGDNGTFYSNAVIEVLKENRNLQIQEKSPSLISLSKREEEILELICEEFSSQEIGEKLFISKRTVDVHRKNLLYKTNTKSAVGLIKFALQNNYFSV